MQNFAFETLWAILSSMLGAWLWPLIIGAVALTVLFALLLLREKRVVARRFMWSQLVGIGGGLLALWLMALLSESRFSDAGGPIDWIIIIAVYAIGACGTAILFYTALGWGCPRCRNGCPAAKTPGQEPVQNP